MYDYKEMIGLKTFSSKPIKLLNSNPNNLMKNNVPLILSFLTYKFLNLSSDTMEIESIIHKPNEVITRNDETYQIGSFKCRMYKSNKIYCVLYNDDNNKITSSLFTSTIIYGYNIFSKLFVRCNIRFISREPVYFVYECLHGPEILVSLRDIISKYGITNDSLFKRRVERIYKTSISKQEREAFNQEDKIQESVDIKEENYDNLRKYSKGENKND